MRFFLRLKSLLIGQRFQDLNEIEANAVTEHKDITLQQFQNTRTEQDHWDQCILIFVVIKNKIPVPNRRQILRHFV